MDRIRVTIGSLNPVNEHAVFRVLPRYPYFADAEIRSLEVDSGDRDVAMTLEESIHRAQTQARLALEGDSSDYGVGIEMGFADSPGIGRGYQYVCMCCFFDGVSFYEGRSQPIECPPVIVESMRRDRLSLKEALERIHFSSVARVKKGSGMLGVLTENAIPESTFVKQAVYGAVIHLLHCGLALPPKRTGR